MDRRHGINMCGIHNTMRPAHSALVAYLAATGFAWYTRNAYFFDADGTPKPYGTGPGQTPCTFAMFCCIAAIVAYAYFARARA